MALDRGPGWGRPCRLCRQRNRGCRGQAEVRGLGFPPTLASPRLCPVPPIPSHQGPPTSKQHGPVLFQKPSAATKEGRRAHKGPGGPPRPPSFLLQPQGHEAQGTDGQVAGTALPPVSWLNRSCFPSFGKATWAHSPLAHQPCGPPGPPGLGPRLQLTAAGPSSTTPLPTPHLTAHSLHLPGRPPSCSFPSASACPDVICRVCAQWLSRVRLSVTPWTVALQAPLSMEFSRQEYWSGQPFPSPGALPDSGIEPASLISPASAGRLFTPSATWEASGGDGHHLPLEASPEASYPSPGTRWILPCPGPWHPCT
ncbi:MAPK-interacting and spindle-stabilizing protein-like [Bos javanicus]|uniref:MAPK-interacting and spindle-stabilizing protein-like n=1 Tax=Bos javanicus TaxID=9906 RepID=UPI002AA71C3B|nr:MAPK-interacting and spindle-stabilizing protein-like [Bos javanicus]